MSKLFQTDGSWPLLVVRLALGTAIWPHGAQKLLGGLFGGPGLAGTVQVMTQSGIPAVLVVLVIVAEFFGSLGLILGFLTRIAAFGVACVMVGAVLLVHWPNGFFMNWGGQQAGEGFEYHILAVGMALALLIGGGGKGSVDQAVGRRFR
jgi:putative oxidoreductase